MVIAVVFQGKGAVRDRSQLLLGVSRPASPAVLLAHRWPTVTRTMMALRAHRRGEPDELVYERAPRPSAEAGEVLVAVHAAAITVAELTWDATWTTVRGADRTPTTPSHELSGVVAEVGPGAGPFSPGEDVVGLVPFHRNGAAADFVAVPTGCLVPRPRSLLHVPAAALSLAGLTAWQAVVDRAGVTPADEVLVLGGTGGVGTFAVQIAAARGARVTATHRGEGRSFLTDLGAESTVDLAAAQLGEAGGRFDVVIDTVGAEVAVRSVALLRDGGRLVTLTAPLPAGPADEARRRGVQAVFFLVSADAGELALLARSAAVGDLRIPIAQTFPLEDGAHAFRRGGSGCRRPGKVVLVVRD